MRKIIDQLNTARTRRYLIVGLCANGLGIAVFQALVMLGVWPELSSLLAFFPAFAVAYILNRNWSFRSKIGHASGLIRYAIVTIACVLLQVAIVWLLHRQGGLAPLLAQFIALAIAVPVSYVLLTLFVFNDTRRLKKS